MQAHIPLLCRPKLQQHSNHEHLAQTFRPTLNPTGQDDNFGAVLLNCRGARGLERMEARARAQAGARERPPSTETSLRVARSPNASMKPDKPISIFFLALSSPVRENKLGNCFVIRMKCYSMYALVV